MYSCSSVWNAPSTWPPVPRKPTRIASGDGGSTVSPWSCSHFVVRATSLGCAPKRAAKSAGVIQWWYAGEAGSCTAATSASRAAFCCALGLK
jgi:hypothetical protein